MPDHRVTFPAGARVPPGGVLVVLTSGNDPTPYPRIDFRLPPSRSM